MEKTLLNLPDAIYKAIWSHLLPRRLYREQAAFLYVQQRLEDKVATFHYQDWLPVSASGFATQSPYYLELTDQMRATVIKQAHDLDASIVEIHSHKGDHPAEFSISDLRGFQEFVPHVWWRLKGRPYLAVVVSRASFDALVWVKDPKTPQQLDGIVTESSVFRPTNLTIANEKSYDKRTF